MNKNITILDHPILAHKLGMLRNAKTESSLFRSLVKEASVLLAYEATRDIQTIEEEIETQLAKTVVKRIPEGPLIVSIMRAGNGMMDAVFDIIPFGHAGHIGIYRDKFIGNTVEYYFKIPKDCQKKPVLLLDPLIATGDTCVASIDRLKQYGVGEIKVLSLICTPQGLDKLLDFHPETKVYTLAIDENLNDQGYIVPGLGDAGDRLFRTK
jgi:uracil phosphoribosyltransferase